MSQMKFVSSTESCVDDTLKGLSRIYPGLTIDLEHRTVYYAETDSCVKVLCGGGSGHEPFTAGFVGKGMLNAAVAGSVFTSPPSQNILRAIMTLANNCQNSGVLVIILNYTGDVLNFGLAIEQAKLRNIKVESVVVDEDCSKFEDKLSITGRRGLCGSAVVMKVAGTMSKMGKGLSEIKDTCRVVTSRLASIGTCVTSCTVPSVGTLFELPPDQMEIGVGVHGEAGAFRTKLLPIKEVVDRMMSKLLGYLGIKNGEKSYSVCVLLNNLGAVSQLEMGIIANEVCIALELRKNIKVPRMYCGPLMTSLDMAGFQICLLDVTDHPEWLEYLDYETNAPAWPKVLNCAPAGKGFFKLSEMEIDKEHEVVEPTIAESEGIMLKRCLVACAEKLIENKDHLNNLDKGAGDGDTGSTLKNLADGVLSKIDEYPLTTPSRCFKILAETAQQKMGGTSGALYSLMFTSAAYCLHQSQSDSNRWLNTYESILETMSKYSTARKGDRTMLDVIIPVYEEYKKQFRARKNHKSAFAAAASIARKKSEETAAMKPRVGRASYVSHDLPKGEDPGAYAAAIIMESIACELCK